MTEAGRRDTEIGTRGDDLTQGITEEEQLGVLSRTSIKGLSDDHVALERIIMTQSERLKRLVIGEEETIRAYPLAINTLVSTEYRLKGPIFIIMEEKLDGSFLACFHEASIYSSGDTVHDAIRNLKKQLIDYYEMLSKEEEVLSSFCKDQLALLREIIENAG